MKIEVYFEILIWVKSKYRNKMRRSFIYLCIMASYDIQLTYDRFFIIIIKSQTSNSNFNPFFLLRNQIN